MLKEQVNQLMDLARELDEKGEYEDAIKTYQKVMELVPNWSVPYYNLGLIYKNKKDWKNSLNFNLKAVELDSDDKAAWWNTGIAATGLGNWKRAKMAWVGFGLNLPNYIDLEDDNEFVMNIGITPVRLMENSEVIWADRIGPARAVIQNIPTKESKRRYKDILLNDGDPNGFRIYEGKEFPVFDELALFKPSNYKTFELWLSGANDFDIEQLEKWCDEKDFGFENWSYALRDICRKCSEGVPHEIHDNDLKKTKKKGTYHLAIATLDKQIFEKMMEKWIQEYRIKEINWKRIA